MHKYHEDAGTTLYANFQLKHCHPRRSRGSSFNLSFLLEPRLRPRGLVEDDNVRIILCNKRIYKGFQNA